MIDLALLLALIFVFALLLLVIAVGLRFGVVPEDERWAVYRLGRFHRFLNPGVVWWLERIDKQIDKIDIRTRPRPISVDGLVLNGVPIGLTFNVWCAFDPARAVMRRTGTAGRERLVTLLKLDSASRDEQLKTEMRERIRDELKQLTALRPIEADAPELARLKPVLAGTEENEILLDRLNGILPGLMRDYGYLVEPTRQITLVRTILPQELLESLGRGRRVDQLRKQFPSLSDEALAQLLASIEGRPQMNLQKIVVESQSDIATRVERRSDGDTMIVLDPAQSQAQRALPATHSQDESQSVPPHPPPALGDDDELSEFDLSILKEIPDESHHSERRSA